MIEAKKKFGQNFLTDKNLLSSICDDAGIQKTDDVLEIGAGLGTLTSALCDKAKKVVSYEIDTDLQENLQKIGKKNLILHFEDALEKDLSQIEKDFEGKYKLVANLPYYITSPLIFKFLKSQKLTSMTVMVQKEVGERMCAKVGEQGYGLLSVSCAFYGKAKIVRKVARHMFHPAPKVDSCVVRLDIEKSDFDEEFFFKVVKSAFGIRRKTLLNTLSSGLGLKKEILQNLPFDFTKRAEELSLDDFFSLCRILKTSCFDRNI